MNVVLPLAALFAGIILVGSAAVFVHDLLEGRWLTRGERGGTGGGSKARGRAPYSERRSAARGGQVVWVRAGSHGPDGSASDQRRPDSRPSAPTAERGTWR